MAFAVGLRFYRIAIRKKGEKEPLEIGPGGEPCDLIDYISDFVKLKSDPTDEGDAQRTWFFEPAETQSIRTVHGYISYGTHGFESKFKDRKTKKPKYQREATDLEEVPLYFQYWVPSDAKYALVAFQSFQGRSCVNFIRSAMLLDFQGKFPGYSLTLNSDLAPKFYPVLSSLQRFWVAVCGVVAAGCGAEPFRLRSTASRRGLMV